MKAKFEQLLKEKGLTVDNLSAPQRQNANAYYKAVGELAEAAKDPDYDETDENIQDVKNALSEIDSTICKYIDKYEVYQERGRKMQDAKKAKKVGGGTVETVVVNEPPKEEQQAAEQIVEQHQQTEPVKEEKKGWGVGAVIGTVLGLAAFTFLGIQVTKGNIPFKRR